VRRRRDGDASGTDRGNARLVYSTGGETAESPQTAAPEESSATGIRIALDRRSSGRVVTVVTGLPASREEAAALARALKAACGAGGTVKDGVLELQGDHRAAVERALQARGLRSKRSGGDPAKQRR
jgi:translation initiation factor 1